MMKEKRAESAGDCTVMLQDEAKNRRLHSDIGGNKLNQQETAL